MFSLLAPDRADRVSFEAGVGRVWVRLDRVAENVDRSLPYRGVVITRLTQKARIAGTQPTMMATDNSIDLTTYSN